MKITFSPILWDEALSLTKQGEILTINGNALDFSGVLEGQPQDSAAFETSWITGEVSRVGGIIHLTLRLPHGHDASAALRYPEPIKVVSDGPVELPSMGT